MIDYQQGKIYTIRCKTDNNLIYVGSTASSLVRRWYNHKHDSGRRHSKINQTTNELGIDNFYIELFELYPCNSKMELEKREGEVIRQISTLNEKIAGRDKQTYYLDNKEVLDANNKIYLMENKEKIKEQIHQNTLKNKERKQQYDKEYKAINKELIAEKRSIRIICSCGCSIIKDGLASHLRTEKHKLLTEP